MGGIRLGGKAFITAIGLPITVYSFNDFGYLALAGDNVELTDKTIDYFDSPSNPLLSPDKTLIALEGNFPAFWTPSSPPPPGFDSGAILTVPVGGGTPTLVSAYDPDGPWMLFPSWRPDSGGLVYIHADPVEGFNGSIVTVDLSAPGVETVLYTPATVGAPNGFGPYRPTYSLDGTKIAFILNNEAGATQSDAGLYVMDANGSNVLQLDTWGSGGGYTYGFEGTQFSWTEDGRIVYSTWAFGGGSDFQIYVINPDGTGKTLLTTDIDTSAGFCLITDRGIAPGDAFAVISVLASGSVRPYRLELNGTGGTILDATHGPTNFEYFRGCYIHENRIWFIPDTSPGIVASIAMDGSDYQVETTLSSAGTDSTHLDGDNFYNDTGVVMT